MYTKQESQLALEISCLLRTISQHDFLRSACGTKWSQEVFWYSGPEKHAACILLLTHMHTIKPCFSNSQLLSLFLRCYTTGFCTKLLDLYEERGLPPGDMRHKIKIDLRKTDKELWAELPTKDLWVDARLHHTWNYLMKNHHLEIPGAWQPVIEAFDREISESDSLLNM